MVLWIGAKGSNRSMYYSIETVDFLGWSLTQARRGMLPGLLSGLAVGSVVFLLPRELKTQLWEGQEWFLLWICDCRIGDRRTARRAEDAQLRGEDFAKPGN